MCGRIVKPSTAKAKGRETENKFVDWLHAFGVKGAERRRLNGVLDKGDIAGWFAVDGERTVCVEVKSGASLSIPQWIRELRAEIKNSLANTGFIAVRPKNKPNVEDWFAVIPMPELMDLMHQAGYLEKNEGEG